MKIMRNSTYSKHSISRHDTRYKILPYKEKTMYIHRVYSRNSPNSVHRYRYTWQNTVSPAESAYEKILGESPVKKNGGYWRVPVTSAFHPSPTFRWADSWHPRALDRLVSGCVRRGPAPTLRLGRCPLQWPQTWRDYNIYYTVFHSPSATPVWQCCS